jgi:superfamily II helicase
MPDFVAELYRAATQVNELTPFEQRRLIGRAMAEIRELQRQEYPSGLTYDAAEGVLKEIERVSKKIVREPDDHIAAAFLAAAELIRALNLFLEAGRRE